MSPQTMDLIAGLQVALEELGLMKEAPKSDPEGLSDAGEEVCVQTEGETNQFIGRNNATVSYPDDSVKR